MIPRDCETDLTGALAAPSMLATDADTLAVAAEDISGAGPETPAAVVRPMSVEELQKVVAVANRYAMPVVVRGGGFSYTGGYWAERPNTLLIDMGGLDGIVDIDADTMTVTVEGGATWSAVYDALMERGLRLPVFGPLSGIKATVGGGLSQDVTFFGSTANGFASEHVASFDVVASDGSLQTITDDVPAFAGDAGALGIKARVTFRVMPAPREAAYVSFAFDDAGGFVAAQQAIAAADFPASVSEAYGFDAVTHRNLSETGFSVLEAAQISRDVARKTTSIVGAVKSIAQLATVQRAKLDDIAWSLHCVVEGDDAAGVDETVASLAALVKSTDGRRIPDTIPRVTRSKPFRNVKALLGPNGERWLPMHGIFPAQRAGEALQALEEFRIARRAELDRFGIRISCLTSVIRDRILIEPQFFWPDSLSAFLIANAQPKQVAAYKAEPPREEARALVHVLRRALTDLFDGLGAAHIQLGKYYRPSEAGGLMERRSRLKAALDPDGLMNPGALGLK